MRLEMRRDPTVILMGEDVAGGATLPHMEGENKEAWGGVLGVSYGLRPEFGAERVGLHRCGCGLRFDRSAAHRRADVRRLFRRVL